ncbi:hypothetical protein GGX14DRAFT_400366 [Mycena pura]|uniref:Uncharacterized protein n=1 Tax=Mycena pura TaxID=153505 RepID=A0AAD6V5U7_9AGAR|nr:hypothetical protein GGX14DRAFT_400366 [Mycena pura]
MLQNSSALKTVDLHQTQNIVGNPAVGRAMRKSRSGDKIGLPSRQTGLQADLHWAKPFAKPKMSPECSLNYRLQLFTSALVDLVEARRGVDALEEAVEPEALEETPDEVEHAGEQEVDAADDLGQGFCRRSVSDIHTRARG